MLVQSMMAADFALGVQYFWPVACASLLTMSFLLYLWFIRRRKKTNLYFKRLGVSGPRPLPFFGNTLSLIYKGEIEAFSQWNATYGPVCGFYLGSYPLLLVADGDLAQFIFTSQFKCFMTRKNCATLFNTQLAGLPPGLFECENPEEWKKTRQITSCAFTILKLKVISGYMEQSCQTLVEVMKKNCSTKDNIDMAIVYQCYALEVAVLAVFGQMIDFQKEKSDLMKAINSLTAVSHGKFLYLHYLATEMLIENQAPWLVAFLKWLGPGQYLHDMKVLKRTIINLIKISKSNETKQSVLDFLVRAGAQENDPAVDLSEKQIVSHCLNFLVAAYDTTSFSLAMCSFLLATHTRVQDKLCDHLDQYWKDNPNASCVSAAHDVPYLHMVVSEALRMYPAAPRLPRKCTQSVVAGKFEFHEGDLIILPVHLFHHNKQVWGDPEVFRPERFSEEELTVTQQHHFMPFGQGPRNCIGFKLAKTEMKAALAAVLRQHKFATSDNEKDMSCKIESFAATRFFKTPLLMQIQQRT